MKFNTLRKLAGTTSILGLAIAALPAMAQGAGSKAEPTSIPAKTDASDAGFERVIVTAQKRAQEAQDVPVSLYSMTGAALERSGVTSIEDLGSTVAGIEIGAANPGMLYVNIRGVTDLSAGNLQNSASNGFYLDETPLSAVGGLQPEVGLWDVERVEVLRGPQGTLFGEGSMGGTIRVITKKPDPTDFFGRVGVGASKTTNGGWGHATKASVNVPIQRDTLALTLGVSDQTSAGWLDIPDLSKKDANEAKQTDGRLAVRWTPSKAMTVDATYLSHRLNNGDFYATSPGVLNPREIIPTTAPVAFLTTRSSVVDMSSLTLNYDFGPASLVSASSLFKHRLGSNKDFTPLAPLASPVYDASATSSSYGYNDLNVFTQELRLVSNGRNRLDWTLGVYYKDDKRDQDSTWRFSIPVLGGFRETYNIVTNATNKSSAVFGELGYAFTEQISAQAGIRYYTEKKTFTETDVTGSMIFGKVAGTRRTGNNDASDVSPKLTLNWKPNADMLFFAKTSKGFRGGGANTAPAQYNAPGGYGPESVQAYELGVKTTPTPNWYVNAYAYRNNWKDLQLTLITGDGLFIYTANAGRASATGGELELGGRVARGLTVGVGLSYTDAKIEEDVRNALGAIVAKSGNRIPKTSKFKIAFTADYTFALTESLKGSIHGRYREASENYSEAANRLAQLNDPTKQLYMKFAISNAKWGELSIFGDNLLNRDDTTFKLRGLDFIPLVFKTYVRPRTLGVEYSTNF